MDKKTFYKIISLIIMSFLITSACNTTTNVITTVTSTPSINPVVTSTASQIPIPSAVIPPTLEPTPDIEPPTFEGFNRVEILPNNFFIAYQPPPGNIFESFAIGGSGGGEEKQCSSTPLIRLAPKPPDTEKDRIGGPGALELCHFPLGEDVEIKITNPSGDVFTFTIINNYKITRFCLPGASILQNGEYRLEASSLWANAALNFTLQKPEKMTVYFPETFAEGNDDFARCVGGINTGSSSAIYFRGLESNKSIQLLLYYEDQGYLLYKTTWEITPDNNGNVVEYIENPQIDSYQYSFSVNVYNPNSNDDTGLGDGRFSFIATNSSLPTPTPFSQPFPTEVLQPEWIQISAGSFLMGASPNDPMAEPTEKPQHYVSPKEYWIQDIEVTNANYSTCVESGKCTPPQSNRSKTRTEYYGNPKYANFPVIYVTYEQAEQYCSAINGRLPTEAEWEKAARAFFPKNEIYPWQLGAGQPNEDIANFGNIWHDTLWVTWGYYDGYGDHPRNMAGNVWEWVEDWYFAYPGTDLKADQNYGEKFRVIRGGSFASGAKFLRISNRFYKDPNEASDSVGFRCVRDTAP